MTGNKEKADCWKQTLELKQIPNGFENTIFNIISGETKTEIKSDFCMSLRLRVNMSTGNKSVPILIEREVSSHFSVFDFNNFKYD